jgi:maltose/maltodextrin transport system permease protein
MSLRWTGRLVAALLALGFLLLSYSIVVAGHPVWALAVMALAGAGFYVYLSDAGFAYRYLFPGLAGMLLFVAFPLMYTVQIGFTNYSSNNLLSKDRARAYLLEQALPKVGSLHSYTLHADGDEFRLVLTPRHEPEEEADPARWAALQTRALVSGPLALRSATPPAQTRMLAPEAASFHINPPLPLRDVLRHRDVLRQLKLVLPDGSELSYAGVREFGTLVPVWTRVVRGGQEALENTASGERYRPNDATGFFETADGARLQPGYKVNIGFGNYVRMFSDPDFRGPFFSIFGWTLAFATLTVVFSLAIGLTLAVVLNWEALRFRTLYRTLLFLPYAVPGFISILVFKGLFNQNFGEINALLDAVFGI